MSEQRAPAAAAAGKSSMLPPMLCSADLHCLDADPAAWAWEVKWDGWRAQLHTAAVRLWSRQGRSLTTSFPDVLAAAAGTLADRDVVLDCELVVLGADGRPDFGALCGRGGRRAERGVRQAVATTPAVLVAFDLLVLDGQDLRSSPWQQRRGLLEQLELPTQPAAGSAGLVCPPAYDDGPALIRATHELGLEGVVAKKRSAPYTGGRSAGWVKAKHGHARDLAAANWSRAC